MAFNRMNDYIFYPNIDLDVDRIKEIAIRHKLKLVKGLATHQRLVEGEPYLEELKSKYPFLSRLYNIYTSPPNYFIPIHICTHRGCALNIPIIYTEDSHTIFYKSKNIERTHVTERVYDIVTSDVEEVFRYTLTQPVIMNTTIPHGIQGGPAQSRTIMSWSIDKSYDEIKELVGML